MSTQVLFRILSENRIHRTFKQFCTSVTKMKKILLSNVFMLQFVMLKNLANYKGESLASSHALRKTTRLGKITVVSWPINLG